MSRGRHLISVTRYNEVYSIRTQLDPFQDVVLLIEAFTSSEYLVDTIATAHGFSTQQAHNRSKRMIPHIQTALQYLHQSLEGPVEVSFLPTYYAILNFLKLYILLGPRHADLAKQRWHGASYPGHAKNSQKLLTENVVLHSKGALPLFYETLTGERILDNTNVPMRDVYPYVLDIGAEFLLATGQSSKLAGVSFEATSIDSTYETLFTQIEAFDGKHQPSLRQLPLLTGFKKDPTNPVRFIGPVPPTGTNLESWVRRQIQPLFIYDRGNHGIATPMTGRKLLVPEEFPIALMFFHMSSVVRYKPEFLAKLRDSRDWPMLAAAQRHSLFKMLLLLWSFLHQKTLIVTSG